MRALKGRSDLVSRELVGGRGSESEKRSMNAEI